MSSRTDLDAGGGEQWREHLAQAGLAEDMATAEHAGQGGGGGVLLAADRAEQVVRDHRRELLWFALSNRRLSRAL